MKDNSMNLTISNCKTADINLTLDGTAIVTISDSKVGAINLTLTNGTASIKHVDSSNIPNIPSVEATAADPEPIEETAAVETTIASAATVDAVNVTIEPSTVETSNVTIEPSTVETSNVTIEPSTVEAAPETADTIEYKEHALNILRNDNDFERKLATALAASTVVDKLHIGDIHNLGSRFAGYIELKAVFSKVNPSPIEFEITNAITDNIERLRLDICQMFVESTGNEEGRAMFFEYEHTAIDHAISDVEEHCEKMQAKAPEIYKDFAALRKAMADAYDSDGATGMLTYVPCTCIDFFELECMYIGYIKRQIEESLGIYDPAPETVNAEPPADPAPEVKSDKATKGKKNDDEPKPPTAPKKHRKKNPKPMKRSMTTAYSTDFTPAPTVEEATADQLCYLLQKSSFEIELFQGAKGKMYLPRLTAANETQLKAERRAALIFSPQTIEAHKNIGAIVARTFQDKAVDLEYVKYDYHSGRYGYTMQPLTYNTLMITSEPPTNEPPTSEPPTIKPPTDAQRDPVGVVDEREETAKTDHGTAQVRTDNGTLIAVKYEVVSASTLLISHRFNGERIEQNDEYPQALQPRDRRGIILTQQVNKMAAYLRPEELTASVYLNQGAPIVDSDRRSVVFNGNGRALAILKAYKDNSLLARYYKEYLIEHAADFGLTPAKIQSCFEPILIRVVDWQKNISTDQKNALIKEIVESTIGGAALSPFEQAKVDAEKLKLSDFNDYNDESNSDLTASSNANLVYKIITQLASRNDFSRYFNAKGKLTKDATARARNAIFALAYADDGMLDVMTLSTDEGARNISNAMIIMAPKFAKLTLQQRENIFYEYKTATLLTTAIKRFNAVRNDPCFKSVDHYFQHQALFDREPPAVEAIMRFFDAHKRSQKAIAELLNNIIITIKRQGNPTAITLDGMPKPDPLTLDNIILTAIDLTNENGNGNLFKPADAFNDQLATLTAPATLASIERNAYKTVIFAKSQIDSHKDAIDIAKSIIDATANALRKLESVTPKTHVAQVELMKAAAALDAAFMAGKASGTFVVQTQKNLTGYLDAFYNGDYDYETREKTTRACTVDGELITVATFDTDRLPFKFDVQAAASPFKR